MKVPDLDINPIPPKPRVFRVFFAHGKNDGDRQIGDWVTHLSRKLSVVAPTNVAIIVTLGRTDHAENFRRCGSWDAWAKDVVERVDYATREPVYQAIVVPNEYVGKATAQIVEAAIAKSKPVILMKEDGSFKPVRNIERVSDSYKDGWRIF